MNGRGWMDGYANRREGELECLWRIVCNRRDDILYGCYVIEDITTLIHFTSFILLVQKPKDCYLKNI